MILTTFYYYYRIHNRMKPLGCSGISEGWTWSWIKLYEDLIDSGYKYENSIIAPFESERN